MYGMCDHLRGGLMYGMLCAACVTIWFALGAPGSEPIPGVGVGRGPGAPRMTACSLSARAPPMTACSTHDRMLPLHSCSARDHMLPLCSCSAHDRMLPFCVQVLFVGLLSGKRCTPV